MLEPSTVKVPGFLNVDFLRSIWPECTPVQEPVNPKSLTEPRVIVKRNTGMIYGPNGEEVYHLPGLPAISLFTGAGGIDIGMEQAGLCTVLQHEWDQVACSTLLVNRPTYFRNAALIQGDIRQTSTGMILKEAGLRVGEAALVTGGPPCQGFSTANINRGKKYDFRNDLVFEFLRVVDDAKPRFFLMENVPGFLSFNKGAYFEKFLETAYGKFYELVYGLLDASEHGVPQHRTRFFCMGTRRDLYEGEGILGSLPAPHCFSDSDLDLIHVYESGELFNDELNLLKHAPGIRYFPDRPVLRPPAPVSTKTGGRAKGFIKFYRDLIQNEPDRIVTGPRNSD